MVSSSFLCKQIPKKNLKSLCAILDSGELSDYTLKTKDESSSIKTHKFILRSSSPFFDKMFTNNFKDSNEDHLVLENVSFYVLNKIVKYLYNGAIEIDEELAQEILDIALFLQLIELVDECTDILCESVNEKNCFELLKYSKTYNQSDKLKGKCLQFILQNLNALLDHQEFVNISYDDIKSLFATEIADFERNEEEVYLATEKWLTHDLEYREQYITDLMDGIKFENISRQFAITRILQINPLMENKYFIQNNEYIMNTIGKKDESNLLPVTKAEALHAIIGNKIISFTCENIEIPNIVTHVPENLLYFGSCTFGSKHIYICGGLINGKKVNTRKYYSTEYRVWRTLRSMQVPRYYNRSVTVSDKIYVCGGYEEKTVEIFDIGKSIWSKGPSLNHEMVNANHHNIFGLCSTDNCIYALNEINFQFLDIRVNVWKDLPVRSNINRKISSAIAYENLVFGFHKNGFISFDIRNYKWMDSDIKFQNGFEYVPASCISNEKMFVFGCSFSYQQNYLLETYNLNNLSFGSSCSMKLDTNRNCCNLFSI